MADPRLAGAVLVGLVAVERLVELVVSRRNEAWLRASGAVERGRGHYPAMVALHAGLLLGAAAEPWLLDRAPPLALAAAAATLVLLAQALRWWCIATLGRRWCTRVLVVPGLPLVAAGPYRRLRHPNYLAVVVEGLALPLAAGAWVTAGAFTLANLALLAVRIRVEEAALAEASRSAPAGA